MCGLDLRSEVHRLSGMWPRALSSMESLLIDSFTALISRECALTQAFDSQRPATGSWVWIPFRLSLSALDLSSPQCLPRQGSNPVGTMELFGRGLRRHLNKHPCSTFASTWPSRTEVHWMLDWPRFAECHRGFSPYPASKGNELLILVSQWSQSHSKFPVRYSS